VEHYDDATWKRLEDQIRGLEQRTRALHTETSTLAWKVSSYISKQHLRAIHQTLDTMKKEGIHVVMSDELDQVRALVHTLEARLQTVEQEVQELRQGNLAHLLREIERESEE
jgi:predicted  nucleic acid-binding Zn-ribbon protein